MTEPTPDAGRIRRLVWDAASAAAVGDHNAASRCVDELVAVDDNGTSLRIAAAGWAALVAEHVAAGSPNHAFRAHVDGPDEKTEIFAAVVCAVGNKDCAGALALLREIEPLLVFEVAVLLLYGAGSAIAAGYRPARRP